MVPVSQVFGNDENSLQQLNKRLDELQTRHLAWKHTSEQSLETIKAEQT